MTSNSIEQSFLALQSHVHSTVSDLDADRGLKFHTDSSYRQRFHCTVHGVVVPLRYRYDCPYCPYEGE